MTGLTLGGSSGATLGGDTGGTLGTVETEYLLDGQPLPGLIDEIATHRTLTLSFRVQTSVLVDRLRPLKTDEGQADVLPTDSGGFTAVDRANGGNSFQIEPPKARRPLRQTGTYHVDRYEEDLVSAEVDEWTVEVDLVREDNRDDTQDISEARSAGEWGFDTRFGTIATDRVDANFIGTGSEGVERFEVTARLTFDEALAFESALSKLDGVRVRSVPDGSNVAVDDTDDDANTVTVTSPTTTVVDSGEYVVMGFESRRLNDAYQEVTTEIARKG